MNQQFTVTKILWTVYHEYSQEEKKSCFQEHVPEFLRKLSLSYPTSPADQVSSGKTNLSQHVDLINQDFCSIILDFFLVTYQIHFKMQQNLHYFPSFLLLFFFSLIKFFEESRTLPLLAQEQLAVICNHLLELPTPPSLISLFRCMKLNAIKAGVAIVISVAIIHYCNKISDSQTRKEIFTVFYMNQRIKERFQCK